MSHNASAFKIISEVENGYIGVCECCRQLNFAYKNTLLTFNEDDLHRFFEWLLSKRYAPEHYAPLHHGRNRMFSSLHSNLFLVYNDAELDEINHLYQETRIMMDAKKILLANRMN